MTKVPKFSLAQKGMLENEKVPKFSLAQKGMLENEINENSGYKSCNWKIQNSKLCKSLKDYLKKLKK